jgi:hypothetical protein
MKKFLQAAALILLTAGIVYAAANSSRSGMDTSHSCRHEWEQSFENTAPAIGKDSSPVAAATGKQ